MNFDNSRFHDNRNLLYRLVPGTVHDKDDPLKLGRIRVKLQNDEDVITSWLRPMLPGLGKEHGIWIIPRVDDSVTVIYMDGKPEIGFWVGGFIDVDTGLWDEGDDPLPEQRLVDKRNDYNENIRHPDSTSVENAEDPSRKNKVQDNIIIKHWSGQHVVLYENNDILIENNHVTLWHYHTGEIDESIDTPDNISEGATYGHIENDTPKGYQRNVKPDGKITELNPHCFFERQANGDTTYLTDGSHTTIIEKTRHEEVKQDVSEKFHANFSNETTGNAIWTINGDLTIQVNGKLTISSVDVATIGSDTDLSIGGPSIGITGGNKITIDSPDTDIN